ncbi:MAG: hypothetical protein KGL25_04475 [Gammaproteobacteria bacterium]|nr:hypothetical protein [Gammaproteobacteria bacterium]MDE2250640.1 hypothetical protein [Gammaproteobacteria bacterium]
MKRDLDPDLSALTSFYMGLLRGNVGNRVEYRIACPEVLDRKQLDLSVGSLRHLDDYLLAIHAQFSAVAVASLLTTVIATTFYVGEVIRQHTPAASCDWLPPRSERLENRSMGSLEVKDFSDLLLQNTVNGEALALADDVMRRIRQGAEAPSMQALAIKAIRDVWVALPD